MFRVILTKRTQGSRRILVILASSYIFFFIASEGE